MSKKKKPNSVLVIRAAPLGLTAAYELVKKGIQAIVLEQADKVGGIYRTETYKAYYFDIGGHRFFTQKYNNCGMRYWEINSLKYRVCLVSTTKASFFNILEEFTTK